MSVKGYGRASGSGMTNALHIRPRQQPKPRRQPAGGQWSGLGLGWTGLLLLAVGTETKGRMAHWTGGSRTVARPGWRRKMAKGKRMQDETWDRGSSEHLISSAEQMQDGHLIKGDASPERQPPFLFLPLLQSIHYLLLQVPYRRLV